MELEIVNTLYVELSQFATAKTERELRACNAHDALVAELKRVLMNAKAPHATDWKIVEERITHTLAAIEKGA